MYPMLLDGHLVRRDDAEHEPRESEFNMQENVLKTVCLSGMDTEIGEYSFLDNAFFFLTASRNSDFCEALKKARHIKFFLREKYRGWPLRRILGRQLREPYWADRTDAFRISCDAIESVAKAVEGKIDLSQGQFGLSSLDAECLDGFQKLDSLFATEEMKRVVGYTNEPAVCLSEHLKGAINRLESPNEELLPDEFSEPLVKASTKLSSAYEDISKKSDKSLLDSRGEWLENINSSINIDSSNIDKAAVERACGEVLCAHAKVVANSFNRAVPWHCDRFVHPKVYDRLDEGQLKRLLDCHYGPSEEFITLNISPESPPNEIRGIDSVTWKEISDFLNDSYYLKREEVCNKNDPEEKQKRYLIFLEEIEKELNVQIVARRNSRAIKGFNIFASFSAVAVEPYVRQVMPEWSIGATYFSLLVMKLGQEVIAPIIDNAKKPLAEWDIIHNPFEGRIIGGLSEVFSPLSDQVNPIE